MARIRRDDTVVVLSGKDRTKTGKVTSVIPDKERVVVQGINMIKRHMKQRPGALQAGIIEREASIHLSNVMLVCPQCGKPTREAHQFQGEGRERKKIRVCKQCGASVDGER